jgi:transposase
MGIDVHRKNAVVTILDDGKLEHTCSIPMQRAHFDALIDRLPGCWVEATYEAGYTGYELLGWLRERGVDARMTAPSMIPKRPGEYVKNDRRDAHKLARNLRGKMLDPIWDLSSKQYEDRELVRLRATLVEERTRVAQRIKAMLEFHGVQIQQKSWSQKRLRWLESGPTGRHGIDVALRTWVTVYRTLNEEIAKVRAELDRLAQRAEYEVEVDILESIPGVGRVTSMTVLTEVADFRRFPNASQFVGYLGLAPSERTSDGRGHRGGLPRKGNPRLRNAIVQAAWQVIRKDERLRTVYNRIQSSHPKHGAQIAIIAVARRLALAMRAMLRDGTMYEISTS